MSTHEALTRLVVNSYIILALLTVIAFKVGGKR